MSDHYKTLGISRNATKDEIKKAFRKKAQEFHPDKQSGDEKKFKEANEAYTVLGNEKKRAQYDQFGQSGPGMGGGGQAGGFGGFDFSGFNGGGAGAEFDMGDIFDMFGGRGGGRRAKRGADISVEIGVTFAESIFGVEKTFEVVKNNTCGECEGTGAKNKKTKTCHTCNGNGRVTQVQQTIMGAVQTQAVCPTCSGTGEIPIDNCHSCKGSGVVRSKEEIHVKIPAGIENGQQLRMNQRGEAVAGGESGDLYILVRVTPDRNFEKIGNDLKTELDISIKEAVLGGTKEVKTVGGNVKIKIPNGTPHGSLLRVRGEGVGEVGGKRGDLYVQVAISIPKKLSSEEKKIFEKL